MKIAKNCQCQISCEFELIPSGSNVGVIGHFETRYIIRHPTLLCPIKRHRTTGRKERMK